MERQCAWCRASLSEGSGSGHPVSHTLCNTCHAELAAGLQQSGLRLRVTGPTASG